jgi:putative oxidoreductase
MRIVWGHQLILSGIGKLSNIAGTIQFFTELGIPSPTFHAYEVGIIELICGFCLFIGFASRVAAIPVILIMLTALSTAHAENLGGFNFIFNPYLLVNQQPYPILFTALLALIFGPGRISIDAWLKRWMSHQPKY